MDQQRCSSLDRFEACPTSAQPCDSPYNPSSLEALAGTGRHKALAQLALTGEVPEEDRITIARDHLLEVEDIDAAIGAGRRVLKEVLGWFDDCEAVTQVEVKLSGPVSIGSADVMIVGRDADGELVRLVILDFKTGWMDIEHPGQLMGYASGAGEMFGELPSCGYITTVEAWLRHGDRVIHNYTDDDLVEFEERIQKAWSLIGTKTIPGEHCGFCKRQLVCDERAAYIRSSGVALAEVTKGAALTRDDLGRLYAKYRMLKSAMARFERTVTAELKIAPLPLPDGKQLELQEREVTKFDAVKVIDIIQQLGFDEEDIRGCIRASKSGIEKAARRHAPPRKGAALMRAITTDLGDADGIYTQTETKKVVVDAEEIAAESD